MGSLVQSLHPAIGCLVVPQMLKACVVQSVQDVTPQPHNGCRPKKRRRV